MDHQSGYKAKLKELQANIKRSKLEHRELEYEFQKLIVQRNDCDRSAMKTVRNKYNYAMEEDKRRASRNEKIKQMLERIDYQACALAAKSDRLKMLKTHYEKNLYRAFGPNSSRTDNSSDSGYTPKQRTKSVDAHTQIPRPNYEVFEAEDASNSRNYGSSVRESRSVSTSRLNNSPFPKYDQRSIRFSTDTMGNSEIQRDPEPTQADSKGVRLFYGRELMNLPNLTVNNEPSVQDSQISDQILSKQHEVKFGRPLENTSTSKPIPIDDGDYQNYQNYKPQMGVKGLTSPEHSSVFQTVPQYQDNKNLEPDLMPHPQHSQYLPNSSISAYPQQRNSEEHVPTSQFQSSSNPTQISMKAPQYYGRDSDFQNDPQYQKNTNVEKDSMPQSQKNYQSLKNSEEQAQSQYQNSNKGQELHSQPIMNRQNSEYQLNSQPATQPAYSQYQKNSESTSHISPQFHLGTNAPFPQNSVGNNNLPPKQNQPVAIPPYEVSSSENMGDVDQHNNKDELESKNFQDDYTFTPNTIPVVKPISANQIETAQMNKPSSPKAHTQILEAPSINIPQGIHQVWEKVVDVEIINPSTKPYPTETNEPRNEVIDKIYKEISSLGEIPGDAENNAVLNSSEIDNRADIIDKIEEHYYGEKIKTEENVTDIYSNPNLPDQNYQSQPNQNDMQGEQNVDYSTTNTELYQDPNTTYEIQNANGSEQVEYQNYDLNEQQYYSEQQDPGAAGHQDNYALDPAINYNMEEPMNDPNYNMYAQNENYQNYATDGGQAGYQVEQPDLQNYIVDENQQQPHQYADEMQNQYYEQQQPNDQQYTENTNDLGQVYSNEVYNQNENYDQQNLNAMEYPVQYNENTSEIYQEYPTDQQPQVESTASYEYPVYSQNDPPPVISNPIEAPSLSEVEDISANVAPSLSSVEQVSSPIIEAAKVIEEIKSDVPVIPKPSETKKKRVNFLDSSDSEQPSAEEKLITKTTGKDQSDSDFEFSVKSN